MLKPIDYKALFDNKITSEELEVDVSTTETGDTYWSEINQRAID